MTNKDVPLSEKRKDSYTVEDLKEGLYRGKDVRLAVQKVLEDLTECIEGLERVKLAHMNFIIKRHFGDKLTGEK
jgi:hypothetical protein